MTRVQLAPSASSALRRTLVLALALVVVAFGVYVDNGPPSEARRVRQNEIARFAPTLGHGLIQMFGETFLVFGAAWIARRAFRVRL